MTRDALLQELMDSVRHRFEAVYPGTVLRDEVPYTRQPAQNLLPHISTEILSDFERGDGGELKGDLPKFCAVHSSSALAANTFGPFRIEPKCLAVGGIHGFTQAQFEGKLSTGISRPNLDFLATGPDLLLAVESKFTEMLRPKSPSFSKRYEFVVGEIAESGWASLFEELRHGRSPFQLLDAAQLLKHYLGVRRFLAHQGGRAVLLYLYWEPSNSEDLPRFIAHRNEVAALGETIGESEVEFRAMSYPELWRDWATTLPWKGIREHVMALRARYELPVIRKREPTY